MTEHPHAPAPAPTFREIFNLILQAQARVKPGERPDMPNELVEPTSKEIADAINAKHGDRTITSEMIRKLRRGVITSPGIKYVSLLADFFELPLDVFSVTGSEASRKVVAELQRFVASKRQSVGGEESPPVKALARSARSTLTHRTRTHVPREEMSTAQALADTTRDLSPQGQARVAEYAQKLREIEQMEKDIPN